MPEIGSVSKRWASPREDSSTVQNNDNTARGERLRPLLALVPYLARYRAKALAALMALTVASLATLVVPLAVRRMIDFGFTATAISA